MSPEEGWREETSGESNVSVALVTSPEGHLPPAGVDESETYVLLGISPLRKRIQRNKYKIKCKCEKKNENEKNVRKNEKLLQQTTLKTG